MTEERKRPIKMFKALTAFGPYRVGDTLQPTGMYRDVLLRRGWIEEIKDAPLPVAQASLPTINRMVPESALGTRSGRRR